MANAITTMTDTIIANKIYEAFKVQIAPLTRFARNFSPDIVGKRGDKVKVAFVSTQDAAQDFTGTYNIQDADAEGQDVELTGHKFVSWGLTDLEIANNPQLSIDVFAAQKANKLAQAVLADIWSVITVANFSNEIEVTSANFDADELADLREDATVLNWPNDNLRTAILAPADYTYLLKDADIKAADAFGSSAPIQNGVIPTLYGFGLMESNLIPANGENLRSFVAYPDAILLAMRYLAPQSGHNYDMAMPITDESGITLGFRSWYDPDTGTKKNVLECNYGKRKGNGSSLIRIQTP